MFEEKWLYEMLKEYYDILEVDENVDEKQLKKAYRFAVKKYHPDSNPNNKDSEDKFKKVAEAYQFLSDEKNRKIYLRLKKKYNRSESQNQKTNCYESQKVKEYVNKYIFQRRDGSKIEIQPLNKYFIEGEKIYKYKVIQYYNNMTIIEDVYGRINLEELMKSQEYCDFCVNSLLSKENIHNSVLKYNGYIGYIEMANRQGKNFYRICDKEDFKNSFVVMELYDLTKSEDEATIYKEKGELWIEKLGQIIINGKLLNSYRIFFDPLKILFIMYSENIDFNEIKENKKYYNAIEKKLLEVERIKEKNEEGGYIGQLLYDIESEDYDVVVDKEIEKVLNIKEKAK